MHRTLKFLMFLLAAGCLLPAAEGQTVTNVIDRFDPTGIGTNAYSSGGINRLWSYWFGNSFQSLSWDATSDANTNAGSGAMKILLNFPGTGGEQFTVWNGINGINPTINGIQFTNLQCDVRFAAGSAVTSSGNFGNLQFGLGTPSYGQDYYTTSVTIPASNTNWVHVSIPLNANTDPYLYNIANVMLHIYDGSGSLTGPSILWVDNIQFVGMATNTGTVTVNFTNQQQRIDGFGASSAWMSGSLSTSDADLLFSTNSGAGLSLLRTRIAPDGTTWEGNIAQQAQARGARIWSTPWSPPVIYKDTNSVNGGNFVSSTNNYQGYASLLANYVANLKTAYGISLYALSIQNEPDALVTYESCWWTGKQFHDFVPYLAAAFTASNVASTKIMLPEDEHWQWNLATNTMNDLTTSNLVGILGGHNYGSSAAPVTQFGTPCPKPLWETEHYLTGDDTITNGLQLAQEIHAFLTVAQANAYNYWWLTGSGTGSIANNTANPAKRLFVMGNYSRFVRPNFYRIGATNNSTALVSAYKDSGSSNFVIVAANPTAYAVKQTFTLTNFPGITTLTQWVTSASLSLSNQGPVSVTNNAFTYLLPPWTVVSLVYVQPMPPNIGQQPVAQTGWPGGSATFTVGAGGSGPLFYQWLFNSTNLVAGATNANLTLTGLTYARAGSYSVIVTNYLGSITSVTAALTINSGPSLTLTNNDPINYSSFNTKADSGGLAQANWSDGNWPTNPALYFTGPFQLRTPAGVGNVFFPGSSLTVNGGGGFINMKGNSGAIMTVTNLILAGGGIGNGNSGQAYGVAGALNVASNSAFSVANDTTRTINISATITGSAALTNGYAGSGLGTIIYSGNNTGFTGPMVTAFGTVLKAGSQTNLGGNPASFNAGQFILDNGIFTPTASFAMANANSGITLTTNGGTFNLATGLTLAISNPIISAGSLVKTGAGNLLLAGTTASIGGINISNGALALTGNANLNSAWVNVASGATLDVSSSTIPLMVTNQIFLAGNLTMLANSSGVSSRLFASNLVFNGTLTISNGGPALVAGNAFALFSASNYSGTFTSIIPATPGSGLVWDTSKLGVNGTLAVAALPGVSVSPIATNCIYGNSVVLSANATGTGPLTYQWYDSQTNAIPGAVFANFTNTPTVSGSGYYAVVVINPVGRATNFAALSVSKALLTISANNTNRTYGAANPGFTASFGGLVNGDSVTTATMGSPALTSTAINTSYPGSYPIVAASGTLTAMNYSFSFLNGTLTITTAGYPTNLTANSGPNQLTLSWPPSHLGWTLQEQTNAIAVGLATNWTDITNSVATNQMILPVYPASGSVFYRLRR